jgi:hypothetical protein
MYGKSKWRIDLLREKIYETTFYKPHSNKTSWEDICNTVISLDKNAHLHLDDPDYLLHYIKMLPAAMEMHKDYTGSVYRQSMTYKEPPELLNKDTEWVFGVMHRINTTPPSQYYTLRKYDWNIIARITYQNLAYEFYDDAIKIAKCFDKFFENNWASYKLWKKTATNELGSDSLNLPFNVFKNHNLEFPRRWITFQNVKAIAYREMGDTQRAEENFAKYTADHYWNISHMTTCRVLESALECYMLNPSEENKKLVKDIYVHRASQTPLANFESVTESLSITYMMYLYFFKKEIT